MKHTIFDFSLIDSKQKLYDFLEHELDLQRFISGAWGRNLAAFKDLYEYSNEAAYFELVNVYSIENLEYRVFILDQFVWVLTMIAKTNNKFSYKIIS